MPFTYDIRRPVIRFTVVRSVNFNASLAKMKEGLAAARAADPEENRWDVIFDLTAATDVRTRDELRGAAMALAQHTHMISRRVALAVAGEVNVEKARSFAEFTAQLGHEPRVFETVRDAEAWLKAERSRD